MPLPDPLGIMKLLLITTTAFALFSVANVFGQSSHYVDGYYRSNGTFVPGHYQTNPNNNQFDNWSTQGNYNPYTGKAGTVNPYAPRAQGHYYYDAYGRLCYSPN